MKIETVLYAIGVVAAIVGIVYFTWEYIVQFTKFGKLILLFALAALCISLGYYFQKKRDADA